MGTVKESIKSKIKSDAAFDIIVNVLGILIILIVLVPLIFVLAASFSDPDLVIRGEVLLWPKGFTLEAYKMVFENEDIWRGFVNSCFYTAAGTLISIVLTIMAAYPLSVRDFKGRNLFMGLFTFTMMFSGGLIPMFLWIQKLHLYDTYWALILPGAVGVYNMIIARTFFQTSIPYDLYESASLDGCSDVRYLLSIVIPLAKPILAVLVMYYGVGYWNQYFNAMIYLANADKMPLQVVLRNIILQNQIDPSTMVDVDQMLQKQGLSELLKYSLIVVSSVPMLILYPFIQKHFVKGVMIGALKG